MKVYFIECAGRIKIGFSKSLEDRLRDLSTGAPAKLNLLGTVEGDRALEAKLHRSLRIHRVSGEWFTDCEPVRAAIDAVMRGEEIEEPPLIRYPEIITALRKIAEPLGFENKVKEAIELAAQRTGLSYWRTFDIWYNKARQVNVHEGILIRDALIRAVEAKRTAA